MGAGDEGRDELGECLVFVIQDGNDDGRREDGEMEDRGDDDGRGDMSQRAARMGRNGRCRERT
jgi:hypothetical protein